MARPAPQAGYRLARLSGAPAMPPNGQRISFGWRGHPLSTPVELSFEQPGQLLRITTALDSREARTVEARESSNGPVLGQFDLRFAPAGQIHELRLPAPVTHLVLAQVAGKEPTWILSAGAPAPLLPHLLDHDQLNPRREFFQRLSGVESVQPFGWMEGCVLDALHDLRNSRTLDRHLSLFLPDGRNLIYEDPVSRPADNRFLNIEETLPVAAIARRQPRHASLDLAAAFWRERRDAEGCVVSGITSAEGSYTVAYPMAVLARLRRDRALEDLAIQQLRLRRDRLATPDALFLRRDPKGKTSFRNWSRGIAWYLLGLTRTLELLQHRKDISDLREEARRAVAWVLPYRRGNALWTCFVDDPATGSETSGSAGIATALAQASRLGLASSSVLAAASETWEALALNLSPDGFLRGVSQSNRGGEALQRSGYRVVSPMAMGLMGQLAAAIGIKP